MSLADIIQIAIAGLTLVATVVVSFLIYWLQRRHEKAMEKVEKKYRQRELEEKAKLFLMDNEEEQDYLSWCVLAANLHRLQKHTRRIYTNYCRCTPELQKEILKQAGFDIYFPEDSTWKGRCFDRLRVDIEKYQLGRDCLYDGAKYFFRGYESYKELPWNETPHLFQPICKENRIRQIFGDDMINIGSYIDEYFYYYLESHMQFVDNNPEPPIDYVWDSQGLGYAEESVVCMWIMELVQEISTMLYNKYHNEKTDTIDLLNYTDAIPETYEDKYYAALQSLYNTYYTGDWREDEGVNTMTNFNEHALEMSIMELFKDEGYTYVCGDQIHRERTEVLLIEDLRQYLYNRYAGEGITPDEVDRIILMLRNISGTIYEANKTVYKLLSDGFILNREEQTQKDLYVELIDFDTLENNIFKVVNQFEIEGINNQLRIPDGIVFINGIPIVVFEFKSAVRENTTIMDAYKQLTKRYRRDIPEIFKYNAFIVISDGANSKYGSFFSSYDFFYAWRKINAEDKELDGINSLVTMVKGLFRKDRLLKVVKNFIYFPDNSDKDLKIVCRYPQFFAANKLYENIKHHLRPEGDGKGGTYFGATGCGKSYTMLFLTRMLMKSAYFSSPTILIITDRNDLDDQLSKQFVNSKKYIGDETVVSIASREKLRQELQGRTSGGVYLTTIQKFTEDLQLLTDRANVICISDEAHRSQINLDQKVKITKTSVKRTYGFAKYLHDSLPNATYVGFTGTPVDGTIEVFGTVIDAYTMTEAVRDGITVNLVYDGRAAKVMLNQEKVKQIEDYYARCEREGANEHQIEESQKAVANMEVILGDPDRLRTVAEDFIKHYETRVAEGATVAGKAMFVCSNRYIAYDLYKIIKELRPKWIEKKICEDGIELSENDKKVLKPIEKIKMVMTRNKDDEKELFDMLGTKDERKELDRQFKNPKSNFKIAIVVDMWLTGFDVPELDTIYIDKPIQQHTLIQTISRVNRVCEGKDKGLIVDYIGIKKNMNMALKKYTNFESEEFEGIEQSITIVKDQLEVLGEMFHNFNSSDFFNGSPKEQLDCLNRAVEYVQLSEELERRFMAAVKRMKQAFNLCSSSDKFSDTDKDYIHFYCAVRSVLFKLTKGDAPDIEQMNARVRQMLEGAIQSDGIEELFETGKHISVDIFSDEYMDRINAIQLPNTKIKILQRLLSQAIDEFMKVNKIMGIEFADRLRHVIDEYNNRRRDEAYANEVLDDVAEQLAQLLSELKTEKNSFYEMGIDYEEKAFYDILKAVSKKHEFEYPEDKMIELSKRIKIIVDDKSRYTDWSTREDIKANLQVDLILLLDEFGYPPVTIDDVYKEVLEQAENFKKYV